MVQKYVQKKLNCLKPKLLQRDELLRKVKGKRALFARACVVMVPFSLIKQGLVQLCMGTDLVCADIHS